MLTGTYERNSRATGAMNGNRTTMTRQNQAYRHLGRGEHNHPDTSITAFVERENALFSQLKAAWGGVREKLGNR